MNQTVPISHHHFMFPFKWDAIASGFKTTEIKENLSFDSRTCMDVFKDEFGKWKRCQIGDKIDHTTYNEMVYFHQHVQKAIYDFDYPWKNNQCLVKYYEYQIDKNFSNNYTINIKGGESYSLILDGVTLHIFGTGVGILTYNLSNYNYGKKEDILRINEFGRRIYPQFLGADGSDATKATFLAGTITLTINDSLVTTEDFTHPFTANKLVTIPSFITELFNDKFIFHLTETEVLEEKILITKVTDDRMFYLSWYANQEISSNISTTFKERGEINDEWFYAYVFGDKEVNSSIANHKMFKEQLENHSYLRWVESKTIYGCTNDSFACLTDSGYYGTNIIRTHMQTMYYAMMVLCLAQRASILKFTAEVANLADIAKVENDKKLMANIKEVYKNYIDFTNKLYFIEVTSQIQGIEIYDKMQEVMNINSEIQFLKSEIHELYQYINLVQDERSNEEAARLNRIAAIFLPASLVFSVMGAAFLNKDNFNFGGDMDWGIWAWIIGGLSPSVAYYLYLKYWKNGY